MSAHIELKTRLLPVLIAAVLIMQVISPYRGWVIILIGLGGVFVLSWLWARSLAHSLRLVREMRFGWMQVGDRLEERFTIENYGWAPALWVEVVDHSTLPDHAINWVTGVGGNTDTRWHTQGLCSRRGLFTLGPTGLRSSDPFGIFTVQIHNPASRSLLVLPPVVPLPAIQITPGGRSGEGRPRPNAPERTVSAGSVREYSPGDSLRWIHWPTTARRNKPYVRMLDGTPTSDWRILLDLDRQVHLGSGFDSTLEHAVILAASLADRGIRARHAVGLAANGSQLAWLPPTDGEPQRWNILRALALAETGDLPLHDLLQNMQSGIRSDTSLIIITPSTNAQWIEALIPFIWRGVNPTVLLLDASTFGGTVPASPIASMLAELEVACYLIPRELLNRTEAHPGKEGLWQWRVTPRGRAIMIQKPGDTAWKVLE
jgi:uncharacterized protein (DUF58 family)